MDRITYLPPFFLAGSSRLRSSSLPMPNTFDQKPRFFLGGSGARSISDGAAAVAADCSGDGSVACAMLGGATLTGPLLNASAVFVMTPRVGCRSQYSVGPVPRAKYSV